MFHVADQLLSLGQRSHLSTRQCSICRNFKSTSEFSVKDKAKGWLETRCKPCKSEQVNEYQLSKKKEWTSNPDYLYFLHVFRGVSTDKVVRAMNFYTSPLVRWSGSTKNVMAQKWAKRESLKLGIDSLRSLDLEKVRETALSYL